jgi:DNA polymerase I-like protein with 3'-5' exonuclease and polymerase domains
MKIIDTSLAKPEDLTPFEREMVYNGLDCCVTAEVLDALLPQLDNHTTHTYGFSKALQGPALEMRLRGILVDQARKTEVIDECFAKIDRLEAQLERIVFEGVGVPHFNWRAPKDLQSLLYDHLQIPPPRGKRSANRDTLEKLEQYLIARQIVRHITTMKDIFEQIKFLKAGVDPDGRMRTSYNIAGTSTGRFSSSYSEFGTGRNLQNIEESLRSIFISDPRMKFAKFDAKQIQSRLVGALEWNILHNGDYLDACEGGDLHTIVAKMMWPGLGWTGDTAKDYKIAETPYYRHYTHRFMCKKLGHGSNFDGKPDTLSTQSKIPLNLVREFQPKYFRAFPAHLEWQEWVENEIRHSGTLYAITGRKRQFWGRRNDPNVFREANAYAPQADESYIVGQGMLNIWHARDAILMFHDHDALTVQYHEDHEDKIIPKIKTQLNHPIQLEHNRTLLIPYDCKVGWNKGDYSKDNLDGLKDYTGHDERKRSPKVSLLDRKLR